MASWLPHVFVPATLALALFPAARRHVLLWAPLAWAPDVDYVVPGLHRAITHSAFLPAILLGVVVGSWRALDPGASFREYATRPGHPVHLSLAAYYLASHIVLDVFAGGVVMFWPLVNTNFFLGYEIVLRTATNEFEPVGEAGTSQGPPELSPEYLWMSYVDTATLAFTALAVGAWLLLRWRRRRHGPVVVRRTATRLEARAGAQASAASGKGKSARR